MSDIFAEMERDAASGAFTAAPSDGQLKSMTELGQELMKIEAWITRHDEILRQVSARKWDIVTRDLPKLMDEAGQDTIGLAADGVDLKLGDYYKAGLPNPDNGKTDEERAELAALRQEGIDFLTEEAPDLLNTTITVTLPKGHLERAQEIVASLTSEQGFGLQPGQVILSEGVHWATLTSWVKEQYEKHRRTDLPLKPLGATVGRIVKIVKRKVKK